jgi:uncharacterized membrane protein
MALEAERFRAIPRWALWARLPVQLLFAWHVVAGTRRRQPAPTARARERNVANAGLRE